MELSINYLVGPLFLESVEKRTQLSKKCGLMGVHRNLQYENENFLLEKKCKFKYFAFRFQIGYPKKLGTVYVS